MAEDNTSPFPLRVSPQVKRVATRLAALGSISSPGDEYSFDEIKIPSVNEAFKVLIAEGLRHVLKSVEADIQPCQAYYDLYHILMEFLILHPNVRYVSVDDFPERFTEEQDFICRHAVMTIDSWDGRKIAGRVDVANRYASYQARLEKLTSVREALKEALVPAAAVADVERTQPRTVAAAAGSQRATLTLAT